MVNLSIGDGLSFPLDFVTQTCAILGVRGSGKTNTAVNLAEELLAAGQAPVIVDPLDVWWGLRSSRDGKSAGFPVIVFGGEHQDIPLEESSGAVIAEFVVEHRIPLILSLRHLSGNAQRRFATDFFERLYHLKGQGKNRNAVHLFIDEADEFCPQRIPKGHERLFGALDRIGRRGRVSGMGLTLISQRPAVVNKDLLSQAEVLICHRTIGPQDRNALESWIEAHDAHGQAKEFMSTLATLNRGEAWVWSPGWLNLFRRVQMRQRKTFDSSATPKAGGKIAAPKHAATVDLYVLMKRMSETIERAKADDPRELRKRIAELERQLKASPQVADKRAIDAAVASARAEFDRILESYRGKVRNAIFAVQACIPPDVVEVVKPVRVVAPPQPVADAAVGREAPVPSRVVPSSNDSVAGSGLRRMLIALAQKNGLSARQVGVRAGMSSASGTFGTYLSKARASGWIEGSRDRLTITSAGLKALGSFEPLPTGRALLEYWMRELGGGAARMLEVLAGHEGSPISADDLGVSAGLSAGSGTFGTYLSKLRTLELVKGGRSMLRVSEDLIG